VSRRRTRVVRRRTRWITDSRTPGCRWPPAVRFSGHSPGSAMPINASWLWSAAGQDLRRLGLDHGWPSGTGAGSAGDRPRSVSAIRARVVPGRFGRASPSRASCPRPGGTGRAGHEVARDRVRAAAPSWWRRRRAASRRSPSVNRISVLPRGDSGVSGVKGRLIGLQDFLAGRDFVSPRHAGAAGPAQ
jgi:hypothetical protein